MVTISLTYYAALKWNPKYITDLIKHDHLCHDKKNEHLSGTNHTPPISTPQ